MSSVGTVATMCCSVPSVILQSRVRYDSSHSSRVKNSPSSNLVACLMSNSGSNTRVLVRKFSVSDVNLGQCTRSSTKIFLTDPCYDLSLAGASSFCLACGHGGHSSHMMAWFQGHDVCPTGCGCKCLQENPMSPGA